MAKKATAEETVEVAPQEIVKAKTVKKEPKEPQWEIKDRHYYLVGSSPLTYTVPARHSRHRSLLWFDSEKNEICYAWASHPLSPQTPSPIFQKS